MNIKPIKILLGIATCMLVSFCAVPEAFKVQERVQITWIDPDREQQNVMLLLTGRISSTLLQNNRRRVAVLPFFDLNKRITELGRALSIDLQSTLTNNEQFTVVERDIMGRDVMGKTIMNELRFSKSGLVDEATIVKLGKFYGTDTLITGWVYDTGNNFKVIVQVLDVERARVLTTAQELLRRNDFRIRQSNRYVWQ